MIKLEQAVSKLALQSAEIKAMNYFGGSNNPRGMDFDDVACGRC